MAEPPMMREPTEQTASLVCRALDAAPVGLAIVAFDGVVLSANRTLVGWSRLSEPPHRLQGLQLLGEQDRDLADALARAQHGESSILDGSRPPLVPHRAGSFRLHVAPFLIGDEPQAASVLYEDRTDPDLAAEAFEASERRFRLLVDSSGDGIVVHRNGILLYVNPAGMNILGHPTPDELVGRRVAELYHPGAGRHASTFVEQGVLDPGPRPVLFARRDGSPVEVEVRASRAPLGDGLATFLFFRDAGGAAGGEDDAAPEPGVAPPAPEAPPLVLVCDDEARLAALTADLLEQHAFAAVTARSLEEVLAVVDRHGEQIAAVLLDLDLGGHDATEVLGLFEQRGFHAPVLLTSGYSPEDVPRSLLDHRLVFGYLGKPYPVDELVVQVRAALAARGVVE